MFTYTQVLLPVILLSTARFGLSLTEDGKGVDPLSTGCRFRQDVDDRIFGGQEAAVGQFPHQVSLRFSSTGRPDFKHFCGGSIITNRFILTAAHCYDSRYPAPQLYRVVLGAHENNGNDGTVFNITRWILHEGFIMNFTLPNPRVFNDIALIETATTIQFNQSIRPIQLHRGFISRDARAIASGWGRTNDEITNLKFINMRTLTNGQCRTFYRIVTNQAVAVHDWDTLCAWTGRLGHGICFGDSGGPLMLGDRLIGLSSWLWYFKGTCAWGLPDAFTRISTYLDWIDERVNASSIISNDVY